MFREKEKDNPYTVKYTPENLKWHKIQLVLPIFFFVFSCTVIRMTDNADIKKAQLDFATFRARSVKWL